MEKLSYCFGVRSVPNTWQPCHVLEIMNYLISRGYHIECFKELRSSCFIVKYANHVVNYKNCCDLCLDYVELYFSEKEEEEEEFFRSRNKKAVKNIHLRGVNYEKIIK